MQIRYLAAIVAVTVLAACSRHSADVTTSAQSPPSSGTTPVERSATASDERPAETASAAAAAAPECKAIEKAAPNSCKPPPSGNPETRKQ